MSRTPLLAQASVSPATAAATAAPTGRVVGRYLGRGPLARLLRWLQSPVQATVESAGYTIAPLHPKYRGSSQQECLVTLVLKVGPGGRCKSTLY